MFLTGYLSVRQKLFAITACSSRSSFGEKGLRAKNEEYIVMPYVCRVSKTLTSVYLYLIT